MYAIASVDGKVQKKEMTQLRKIVKSEFHAVDREDGQEAAFYIEFQFGLFSGESPNLGEAYRSFVAFVHKNDKHITTEMITHAIVLTQKVAAGFKGINKGEKKLLEDIKRELGGI